MDRLTSRPDPAFCFMMVVWGARYRAYFTDYCLPSLLAPHNIPSIVNKRDSRFAIATTAEDWAALNELDVFKALRTHIEPVLMELPPFEDTDSKMLVMSSGHKKLSNYAFEAKSFGININPDSIYSDHTVSALQDSARRGVKMALYPGVRFEFESVVEELRSRGMLDDPTVIAVPPRVAAGIGIRNPHPFTVACHWDNDCFFEYPVYHYVVDDRRSVMIVHTISMGPIMLDYGAIDAHRDEIFEKWTLDGDYAHSNFGHFDIDREIEYVVDSDTFMVLGFTPKAEDNPPPVPVPGGPLLRNLNKGLQLWRVYSDPVADPLKKRVYLRQVVFHENDLGRSWKTLAARDRKILERYVVSAIDDEAVLAYYAKHGGKPSSSRAPTWMLTTLPVVRRLNIAHRLSSWQPRVTWMLYRGYTRYRVALARTAHQFTHIYNRADFYRRHYSAQGPAHVRYYYWRAKFHVLHTLSQGKGRLRAVGGQHYYRVRAMGGQVYYRLVNHVPGRARSLLRRLTGRAERPAEKDVA